MYERTDGRAGVATRAGREPLAMETAEYELLIESRRRFASRAGAGDPLFHRHRGRSEGIPADEGRSGRRIAVIVNPGAGERSGARTDAVRRAFARARVEARVEEFHPDRVERVVRALVEDGFGTIVAAGGDGTASAIARHLVGTAVRFGVLPTGTTNRFARNVGLPLDLGDAISVVAEGATRRVDLAAVNGRPFLHEARLGDAAGRLESASGRGDSTWGGLLARRWSAVRRARAPWLVVETSFGVRRIRCRHAIVGHRAGHGPGSRATPTSLERGALSVRLFAPPDDEGFVLGALRALAGRGIEHARVEESLLSDLVLHPPGPRADIALDGEATSCESPLRFCTLPRALSVVVPRGSR